MKFEIIILGEDFLGADSRRAEIIWERGGGSFFVGGESLGSWWRGVRVDDKSAPEDCELVDD